MNRILKLSFKSQHNENNAPKNSLKLPFYLKLKTLHAVYSPSFSWGRRGYWGRPQKRRAGLALFIATTEGGFNDQVRFRLRWFYSLWNGTSLFFSLLFFSFFLIWLGHEAIWKYFPLGQKLQMKNIIEKYSSILKKGEEKMCCSSVANKAEILHHQATVLIRVVNLRSKKNPMRCATKLALLFWPMRAAWCHFDSLKKI